MKEGKKKSELGGRKERGRGEKERKREIGGRKDNRPWEKEVQ